MVSPRKEQPTLSHIQEEPQERMIPSSTKSCESLYSNSSSSKGTLSAYRRAKHAPQAVPKGQANGARQPTLIPAATEVRQRVLSARRLRFATFQNQLADAQQTIAELAHENRILRTLHKRQDTALSKYESTNAELPKLLHSHAEEMRVWQTKYRNLQQQFKDLEQKLKQKESLILQLSDQNKYYSQLNKDRNLEERQRLTEKLHQMEMRLQEKDQDMKLLARKVQIEAKNFRQQVLNEQRRTKQALLKLEKARLELSGYRKLDELELADKFPSIVNRTRKSTILEETKLEKDLEKILEEEEKQDAAFAQSQIHSNGNSLLVDFAQVQGLTNPNSLLDDDPLASHRSSCSGTNSKLDNPTARTIRKSSRLDSSSHHSSTRLQSASSTHRRTDRGDGDASVLSDYKQNSVRQKLLKPRQPEQQKKHKKKSLTPNARTPKTPKKPIEMLINEVAVEYEDDYELIQNGVDDEYNISQEPDEDADNDDVVSGVVIPDPDDDDENGDSDEEHDPNDSKDEDYINTAKKKHMKDDISSIRKQLNEDYKEREAFLDTFCRQATSGVLLDDSPKKRAPLAQKLPSSRKNKLLAALKAIDDNKSQE